MQWFPIIILIGGVWFMVFGFRLLFQKGYVEKLREGIWKEEKDSVFAGKKGYNIYRYGRGLNCFISGLIFVGVAIYVLVKMYGQQ